MLMIEICSRLSCDSIPVQLITNIAYLRHSGWNCDSITQRLIWFGTKSCYWLLLMHMRREVK